MQLIFVISIYYVQIQICLNALAQCGKQQKLHIKSTAMETGTGAISGMGDMDMKGMNMMSMMSISWDTSCVIFLFDFFHARNTAQFASACFLIFLAKIMSELLQLSCIKRIFTGQNPYQKGQQQQNISSLILYFQNISETQRKKEQKEHEMAEKRRRVQMKKQSLHYNIYLMRMAMFNMLCGLSNILLMLIAMTMNGYVIISIAAGTGFGKTLHHYLSDKDKLKLEKQNKHDKESTKQVNDCCQM